MPNLSDLFSAGGFLKWDGAGNTDADYTSQAAADLAADAAFTGAFGVQRVWVPADDMSAVFGAPSSSVIGWQWPVWMMDAASNETVGLSGVTIPPGWTTFAADLYWINGGAGSGDVVWRFDSYSLGASDDLSSQPTDGTQTADTAGAQNVIQVIEVATGLTVPAAGDVFTLRVNRRADQAGDTLANDAGVVGVLLRKET